MSTATLANIAVEALKLTLVLSMPTILVATGVGLVVSLVQALTQVQEQTLPFAVKLICVSLVLMTTGNWIGRELYQYTLNVFNNFGAM
ncbi:MULTISPECIES: type III secretion system export apparatus subunit SctS [unclassified Mesorhizobium]|uniref:type III secretion system export apparatus subunit SctS n=1 Tax=unclassified Mesorhizobium TaxID=325217 RepID=UPI000FCBEFC7|nr:MULTISPECIES: type III secretion system export apparatus subunit SctS [unclassified Mesorhizobium]RUV64380.1 EscS/YscS/HrcS family type III secretion system export apparatus protein [Mesorhizobium sp. M5C.F.Ca.IN.020.29.1.1]RWA97997.1 MAG: EscS/YscS/HrcS family type III secretion system export apparatus protein [Mesorhizobium sp.]RWC25232.1 MAG: EscS/YscS/HrcS family type III secretion system export apparatus protein [Mesorhizobium sp.]RWD77508.1 MAG: EscS/YscS/HrcS family type III secretion